MRIITGDLKGKQLAANPGMTTRPITDRAKIKLFDNLKREFRGLKVADIFSGTGSMGLEALSRGAAVAVLVEADRKAHELLRKNVANLGVEDRAVCWRTDVLRCSFRPQFSVPVIPYDIVFFDPPYKMAESLTPGTALYKALERLSRDDVTAAGASLVARCGIKTTIELPPVWLPTNTFIQGSMRVCYFEKQDPDGTDVSGKADDPETPDASEPY